MNVELIHAMLCWDGETNRAKVIRHPDQHGVSDQYECTNGACEAGWQDMTDRQRLLRIMLEAWQAVVCDGIAPAVMHEALIAIPEFRASLAADVPGFERTAQ